MSLRLNTEAFPAAGKKAYLTAIFLSLLWVPVGCWLGFVGGGAFNERVILALLVGTGPVTALLAFRAWWRWLWRS